MSRVIFCLALLFSGIGYAQVSIHPDLDAKKLQNSDDEFWAEEPNVPPLAEEEFEIENAQWRCPPNCPPPRMWTCWVRNSAGRTFAANGRTRDIARRNAMARCAASSHTCILRTCR